MATTDAPTTDERGRIATCTRCGLPREAFGANVIYGNNGECPDCRDVRYQTVHDLRGEGLLWREIGAIVGIRHDTLQSEYGRWRRQQPAWVLRGDTSPDNTEDAA